MTNLLSARSDTYWNFFVSECARLKAPLYLRLTEGVRDDARLRALAEQARAGQPMANLLFGAVHYLLLRGAEHPLRAHYRTLGETRASGDPFPLFRDFCFAREAEIAPILASRTVNTNEVGRSIFLHAAFLSMARTAPQPFHVIEIGPSAGLNLHWDSYGYRYVRNGAAMDSGAPKAGLVIETQLIGDKTPPLSRSPEVGLRLGLERDPVDLGNADECDWLRALVWPDRPERLRRLEGAMAAVRGLPLDIRRGDALALLPDALAECPAAGTPAIVHTMAAYQLAEEEQRALEDLLTLASLRRAVWRLSMEYSEGEYPLVLSRYFDGARESRRLALCHSWGDDLEWLS